MKTLIINADDAGVSDIVNEGIVKCYQAGALTGVSVMACGRRFREAARMLKDVGAVEVGAHLTLTGGFMPCTQDHAGIKSFIGDNGAFLRGYKQFAARYITGRVKKEHVYREFSAQIETIEREGLKVTHLDSHEHVHLFPAVLDCVIKLAGDRGLRYVRVPAENSGMLLKRFSLADVVRHAALKPLAVRAASRLRKAGLVCNDAFWGHVHSGRLDDQLLCEIIDYLTEGVNEIAVHPSVFSRALLEESPGTVNSVNEMKALIEGAWRAKAEKTGIALASHSAVIKDRA